LGEGATELKTTKSHRVTVVVKNKWEKTNRKTHNELDRKELYKFIDIFKRVGCPVTETSPFFLLP
jgi:hypothetical protein